jgi:hypothetical protein
MYYFNQANRRVIKLHCSISCKYAKHRLSLSIGDAMRKNQAPFALKMCGRNNIKYFLNTLRYGRVTVRVRTNNDSNLTIETPYLSAVLAPATSLHLRMDQPCRTRR